VKPKTIDESVRDLVAYFCALPPDARREYDSLAKLDRDFGEDVVSEQRERAKAALS